MTIKRPTLRDVLPFMVWAPMVTRESVRADLIAGLTGATIVLPQGVAFAAIAGLPPEYGFYTAMVPAVIAALFGSSWHLVSGPTTAISALVFAALVGSLAPGSSAFIQAAIALTLMVGLFQLALGLGRLGALVDFVSHSVMIGFTGGAALLIGLSQVRHALGMDLPRPEHFLDFVTALATRAGEVDPFAVLIAVSSLATAIAVKRYAPRAPNYLIALGVGSALAYILGASDVAMVGHIPSITPGFAMPIVETELFRDLAPSALAIALVGLLEAASISRAISIKSGQNLDANQEFVGQGLSNIIGSFFQCYASSGSFTRSGVNFEAGARTPLAALAAAAFLLLILIFVGDWFAYVPIPAMAGVIILVAWKLIDFKGIQHIVSTSRNETAIAIVTCITTLFINLEFAIYVGVFLSLLIFLKKTANPFLGIGAPDPTTPNRMFRDATGNELPECPQVVIVRLDGPFYFGSVEHIRRWFRGLEVKRSAQKHMLFIIKGVGEVDLPGAELLIEEAARRKRYGGSFHVLTKAVRTISRLQKFKVSNALSLEHVHTSKGEALEEIIPRLDPSICEQCKLRIFRECAAQPGGDAALSGVKPGGVSDVAHHHA